MEVCVFGPYATLDSAVKAILADEVKGWETSASYFDRFSAAEVFSAIEAALSTSPEEMELVKALSFALEGLNIYKMYYTLLRILPKIVLPAITERRVISYRLTDALSSVCKRCCALLWDPIVKTLVDAILARRDGSEALDDAAKKLLKEHLSPQSFATILCYLLDGLEEGKADQNVLYQYLATILEPRGRAGEKDAGRLEPFCVHRSLLLRLLTLLSDASPAVRQFPSYSNVLIFVAQVYGAQCYADDELRELLKLCAEKYDGVLKQTLDDILRDRAVQERSGVE